MKNDYSDELQPEVREKMKKNLVYVAILSIVMIFAGLTSAYIVSMGDTFWIKYPLPPAFWISSAFIFLSSLFYVIAIRKAKENNSKALKLGMVLTLLLGIGFGIFQVVGYKQLVKRGAHFSGPIIVTEGRYGDYFELKYKGDFIEVNGNDFYYKGKLIQEVTWKKINNYILAFDKISQDKGKVDEQKLNPDFTLIFKSQPLQYVSGSWLLPDGKKLTQTDFRRLQYFAWNIRDRRGDFFHKGELGKDFHLYYKGVELSYTNRSLYYKNQVLAAPLQIKANQTRDLATSYLYILTILHLLHIFGALIYLVKMVKLSFSGEITDKKVLSLRLGGIFWHFLGLLWLYLLVFLLFIH